MKKIGICLSLYNGSNNLIDLLTSLEKQIFKDFTLYIRDDCSTDDSLLMVKDFMIKSNLDIIFIDDDIKVNLGSTLSFMKIFNIIKNDYIMFCDQDDIWLKNKIEISINTLLHLEEEFNKRIPIMVFTDLKVVDNNLNVINKSFWDYQKIIPEISTSWKKLLAFNVVTGCTMVLNSKCKEIIDEIPSKLLIHDQWIAYCIAKKGVIRFIDEPTILYRQHDSNVVGAQGYNFKYILLKLSNLRKVFTGILILSKNTNISFVELVTLKVLINIKRSFIK